MEMIAPFNEFPDAIDAVGGLPSPGSKNRLPIKAIGRILYGWRVGGEEACRYGSPLSPMGHISTRRVDRRRCPMSVSRRRFFQLAGTGLLLQSQLPQFLKAQAVPGISSLPGQPGRSKVALIHGDNRRKNVYQALVAIDDQIKAGLRRKKYVVIKPNNVSVTIQLAATNADALNGILDYLEPRFRGPVVIAESSAQDTLVGFENFKYNRVAAEHRSQHVSLLDLNREGKYVLSPIIDTNLHVISVRLAARLLDPDAYVISSAMLKTHNRVVATLSVKNMAMGAPLHSVPGESRWNDKHKVHPNDREGNSNMLLNAQKLQPNWGVALIDGFEGMEGNGPSHGTPVPSHLAIASTDFVAADRVALETMSINPDWVGYLTFAGRLGLGQYDLSKIDLVGGTTIASVQKKYRLHDDIQQQLEWMGPLTELPRKMSNLRDPYDFSLG